MRCSSSTTYVSSLHPKTEILCSDATHGSSTTTREERGSPTMNEWVEREEMEEVCPICLGGEVDTKAEAKEHQASLVYGKCGHQFCLPCLKQLFAAPSRSLPERSFDRDTVARIPTQDDILNVPTMGRCPICRGTLCLLDLRKRSSHGPFTAPVVSRETDISQTELAGMVFVKHRRKEGEESIHFPNGGTDGEAEANAPFLSLENLGDEWTLDDNGPLVQKKVYFDPGSISFHKESRTFHGIIRWDQQSSISDGRTIVDCAKRLYGSNAWEYILSFSSDFRYVAKGVLIKRRDPCRHQGCQRVECKFPLDGEWTVNSGRPDQSPCNSIRVHGYSVFSGDESQKLLGKICYGLPSYCLMLSWIDSDGEFEHQTKLGTLAPEESLAKNPEGPPIGASIHWSTTSNDTGTIIWRRRTVAPFDTPLQVLKLGSIQGILYHQLGVVADDSSVRSTYFPEKPWGNTFCQALTIGLASYHFNEDGSAYISYEHERTSAWPNLDNGEPIPPTIPFTNTSFDEERKTFKGTIDWEGTQGSTWTSSKFWSYEMVFAQDYSMIVGGCVRVMRRGEDVEATMSKFGEDLLYINAGFVEELHTALESRIPSSRMTRAYRSRFLREEVERWGGSHDNGERLFALYLLALNENVEYPATRLSSTQNYGL